MKKHLGRMLRRLKNLRPVKLRSSNWSWESDGDWSLSEDDLSRTLVRHEGEPLLFGRFPVPEVMEELREAGILERIEERGYRNFFPEAGSSTRFEDRFRLWAEHPDSDEPCMLVDIRTQNGEVLPVCPCCLEEKPFRALIWDWISFQDPMAEFPSDRARLPGQIHPGLGIFREATRLMLRYVRQMDVDAVVAVPEYFHNAVLYSPLYRFYDAIQEGRLRALMRDVLPSGLSKASHALAEGKVLPVDDPDADPFRWVPAEQVYPLTEQVAKHFQTETYRQRFHGALQLDYVLL